MSIFIGVVAIVALILLTAFFVCGEFALVAADPSIIEERAERGSRSARGALQAMRELSVQGC